MTVCVYVCVCVHLQGSIDKLLDMWRERVTAAAAEGGAAAGTGTGSGLGSGRPSGGTVTPGDVTTLEQQVRDTGSHAYGGMRTAWQRGVHSRHVPMSRAWVVSSLHVIP